MTLGLNRFNIIEVKNKKILILGDMLELGDKNLEEHKKIGDLINNLNIDIVFTFGHHSKNIFKRLNNTYLLKEHFIRIKDLKNKFNEIVSKNDLVYIKGSRSMQLERIYS